MKRLRALPPAEAWREAVAMDEPSQVTLWLELFRRTFDDDRYATAREHADAATLRLGATSIGDWLAREGVEVVVSSAPSTFGTATVRAWLDTRPLRVTLFEAPLDKLERLLTMAGSPLPRETLRDAVLAHEIFHVMHPECPGDLAEMGAHLFATRVTALGCYAGLLDVLQAMSRWWG